MPNNKKIKTKSNLGKTLMQKTINHLANLDRHFNLDELFSSVTMYLAINRKIMLKNILTSLNLTPKEIKIFQTLLEVGAQPASSIARLCELPRNTVRSILDKLAKQNLLLKTRRANTQYYSTETKESIIRSLKTKKAKLVDQIDTQVDLIQQYGDQLNLRHHSKTKPKITFYEGLSGLEKVYEDTLTSKTGLKSWASYDHLIDVMPEYFYKYFKRRAQKKIPMISIHPDTPKAREMQKRDKQELRQSALVPLSKYNCEPEIQVYNNKVNITSWKENIGIIIESQEIANALSSIFDLSYESAKKYKKYTSKN